MNVNTPIPAAQYLRMSTDHQQYSLDNQADATARYALNCGFVVAKTYADAARSGVLLRNRDGLKQLLKDNFGNDSAIREILIFLSFESPAIENLVQSVCCRCVFLRICPFDEQRMPS